MKTQLINEAKRLQQLAGINEMKVHAPGTPSLEERQVLNILRNNGIDEQYLEDNDNEVESGSEEWMGVIEELTGADPYEDDLSQYDKKINDFISVMENKLGITFI